MPNLLEAKFSAVSLLNLRVVMYVSCLWSVIFVWISLTFVAKSVFLTKLLTFGILFSAGVKTEVIAKPQIIGISDLPSFIYILRIVLAAKLVLSGILSSISFIIALYSVFLTTWFLTI